MTKLKAHKVNFPHLLCVFQNVGMKGIFPLTLSVAIHFVQKFAWDELSCWLDKLRGFYGNL